MAAYTHISPARQPVGPAGNAAWAPSFHPTDRKVTASPRRAAGLPTDGVVVALHVHRSVGGDRERVAERGAVDQADGRDSPRRRSGVGVANVMIQDVHPAVRVVGRDPVLQRADVDVEHVHADVLTAVEEGVRPAGEDERARERVGRLPAAGPREVRSVAGARRPWRAGSGPPSRTGRPATPPSPSAPRARRRPPRADQLDRRHAGREREPERRDAVRRRHQPAVEAGLALGAEVVRRRLAPAVEVEVRPAPRRRC